MGICFGPSAFIKSLYARMGINQALNKYLRHYLLIIGENLLSMFPCPIIGCSLSTNISLNGPLCNSGHMVDMLRPVLFGLSGPLIIFLVQVYS